VSLRHYSTYRDTPEVGGIAQLPAHWEVQRIGYYFAERREKVSDRDFRPLSVTKDGIVPQLETAAKTDAGDNRKRVRPGDFVINSRSDRRGSAGISELDGSVSLISTVLRPRVGLSARFVHHLLRSPWFQEEFYRNGKGIVADLWTTNYSEMRDILIPMPPHDEQAAIAAFLDDHIAATDRLVSEQRRLIDLLAEKRQAVISHAVTKGLNPDAPMKPSGVEWLGDVPAHWRVTKVKYVATVQNGSTPSRERFDYWVGGTTPWLNSGLVNSDPVGPAEQFVTAAALAECHLPVIQPPAVLIAITGQGKTRGTASTLLFEAAISQHVAALKPARAMEVAYLKRVFEMAYPYLRRDSDAAGSTKGAITCEDLGNFAVPCPPLEEQNSIATAVNGAVEQLNTLGVECERAVDLLRERRTALISAAVTGQIDVRGLAAVEVA